MLELSRMNLIAVFEGELKKTRDFDHGVEAAKNFLRGHGIAETQLNTTLRLAGILDITPASREQYTHIHSDSDAQIQKFLDTPDGQAELVRFLKNPGSFLLGEKHDAETLSRVDKFARELKADDPDAKKALVRILQSL